MFPGLKEWVRNILDNRGPGAAAFNIREQTWTENVNMGPGGVLVDHTLWWLDLGRLLEEFGHLLAVKSEKAEPAPELPKCRARAEKPERTTEFEVLGEEVCFGDDGSQEPRAVFYGVGPASKFKCRDDLQGIASLTHFIDIWFADNWEELERGRLRTPLNGYESIDVYDARVNCDELLAALKGKRRKAFDEDVDAFLASPPTWEEDEDALAELDPRITALDILRNELKPSEVAAIGIRIDGPTYPGDDTPRTACLRCPIEVTNALCRKYRLPVSFREKKDV